MKTNSRKPWYANLSNEFSRASAYIFVLATSRLKLLNEAFLNFDKESMAEFIFESNNIEREGLSAGETKQLVFSEDWKDSQQAQAAKEAFVIAAKTLADLLKNTMLADMDVEVFDTPVVNPISNAQQKKLALGLIAKFGVKKRAAITVLQHYIAVRHSERYIVSRLNSQLDELFFDLKRQYEEGKLQIPEDKRSKLEETLREYTSKPLRRGSLITERNIKYLHKEMAKGLIDTRHAQAGIYRKHRIMTSLDSHFPAPQYVQKAMRKYFNQYKMLERANAHPIVLAAWASSQFVRIHPFSDFNGRMSRLIMNMVLRAYGVPFWVAIRSNKKDRRRYFYALKNYSRRPDMVLSLISKHVNSHFEAFNQILELSGEEKLDITTAIKIFSPIPESEIMNLRWPLVAGHIRQS